MWGVLAAVLVLLAGLTVGGVVLWNATGPGHDRVSQPQAPNQAGGILLGNGPVEVDVYLDYLCESCAVFYVSHSDRIARELEAGTVSVRFHPLGWLDERSSGGRYSTRAAAAAVCAADQDEFIGYSRVLFESRPASGSTGHDDATLVRMGDQVHLGARFADCVDSGTYLDWVELATVSARNQGVASVPYVTIDGEVVQDAMLEFGSALDEALR